MVEELRKLMSFNLKKLPDEFKHLEDSTIEMMITTGNAVESAGNLSVLTLLHVSETRTLGDVSGDEVNPNRL